MFLALYCHDSKKFSSTIYNQFIAEFFVKELVKNNKLIDLLQKAEPNEQIADEDYDKEKEQNIYNNTYENLYNLLDYCSNINTEQIKKELRDTYIQTISKNEELLGIEDEEYEGLCYQP